MGIFYLENADVDEKDKIVQKFRISAYEFGSPGYGYGTNFDAECFGDDDSEIDGSI